MSKRVQFIRHATAAADAFSGLEGELTVDTTKKELRVHDGTTAGGIPHARADLDNVDGATTSVDGKLIAADKQKLVFITITQNVDLDTLESDVTAALADIIAIETKTDFISITQSVNLDTIESDIVAIETKTDHISVSQAVNLDTMESDIVSNNAKVSNATHTGHVTGATGLTLVIAAITGQTLQSAGIVDADEFLMSDAGVIKRSVFSRIYTYVRTKLIAATNTWNLVQTFTSRVIFNAGITENALSYTVNTGTKNLNMASATLFYPTAAMTAVAVDFTVSNVAGSGTVSSFTMELRNMAANTDVTPWPTAFVFIGGEPTWTSGRDIITGYTRDGGTTWYIATVGLDVDA